MLIDRGATCARAVHGSFLDADPYDSDHAHVSHILLDPSCSSSGMSLNPVAEPDEIAALAEVQKRLVLHAMRFPSLQVSLGVASPFRPHPQGVRQLDAKCQLITTLLDWSLGDPSRHRS